MADKPDRDTFFGYLQWTRESFRNFHFPIVFWVSKNIYNLMLSETPDFWSWRNGVFFFKADAEIEIGEILDPQLLFPLNPKSFSSSETSLSLVDIEQLVLRISQRNPDDPGIRNDIRSSLGNNSKANLNGSFPRESVFQRFHLFL